MSYPIIGEKTKAAFQEGVDDSAQSAESSASDLREVQRVFTVIQHMDGSWQAVAEQNPAVKPILPCTVEDMAAGAHAVENAIQASQIASVTVRLQMGLAQQMHEQAANQQLLSGLNLKG